MTERAPHLDDIAAETAATVEHLRLSAGVAEMSKSEALHGGLIEGEEKGEGSEDRAVHDDAHRLYGAIDGMGGYYGGAIAAETVSGAALSYITEHTGTFTPENGADLMRNMFRAASNAVNERAATDSRLSSMGAVAAIGHFFEHGDRSYIAVGVVGDAKFFLNHHGEDRVTASSEECLPPPYANIVTNAIQPGLETELVQFDVFEVKDGDRVAFLTDGITGDDPEDKLRPGEGKHALNLATPQESADYFLSVSADRKLDDKTAVVVGVHTSAPDTETLPLNPEAEAALARAEAALGLDGIPEAVTAPKPEPAPAPDETAPKPKTPETPSETIARLEAENIRLHERVTELETRIGGLTTEITSLRTRIDELLARRPEPVPPPEPEPRPRLPRPEAGRRDDTEFGPENVPPHLAEYYRLTNAVAMAKVGKAMRILSEGMSVEGLAKEATRAFTLKAYNDAKAMFEDHGDYVNYLAKIDAHPEAAGPRGEDDDETSDLAAALKRRRAERRRTS